MSDQEDVFKEVAAAGLPVNLLRRNRAGKVSAKAAEPATDGIDPPAKKTNTNKDGAYPNVGQPNTATPSPGKSGELSSSPAPSTIEDPIGEYEELAWIDGRYQLVKKHGR